MASDYVEWFVNRDKQRRGFMMMLEKKTPKQIMIVKAPAEMGKTWLIQRLYHECRSRNLPVALMDFSQRQPWDYLTLVRQARDQLGSANFNYLTQVINEVTSLRVENVAVNVAIADSQLVNSPINVSEVKLTTDNFATIQTDSDLVRRNMEIRINDAFFVCLQSLVQLGQVVFLFDTADLAPASALDWIVNNLLWRLRNDELDNVLLIIAGREVPELDQSWNDTVAKTGLDLFTDDHIDEFIVKRGLTGRPNISRETLMLLSRGHPGLLGKMADNALLDELKKEPEPWI